MIPRHVDIPADPPQTLISESHVHPGGQSHYPNPALIISPRTLTWRT